MVELRLATFGLEARVAIAGTAGAAWALSHAHKDDAVIVPGRRTLGIFRRRDAEEDERSDAEPLGSADFVDV